MPTALNARVGRTRPVSNVAPIEPPLADGERTTQRRRPADRGSIIVIKSWWSAALTRVDRLGRVAPRSAADPGPTAVSGLAESAR